MWKLFLFSIDSGHLIIDNSLLLGNKAGASGGGVAGVGFSAVTIRSSKISQNSAAGGGGGLALMQVETQQTEHGFSVNYIKIQRGIQIGTDP